MHPKPFTEITKVLTEQERSPSKVGDLVVRINIDTSEADKAYDRFKEVMASEILSRRDSANRYRQMVNKDYGAVIVGPVGPTGATGISQQEIDQIKKFNREVSEQAKEQRQPTHGESLGRRFV